MLRTLRAGAIVLGLLALACSSNSTSFNTTWSSPEVEQLRLEEGTKVLAMVVSGNVAKRRSYETALVDRLNELGLDAVAAFEVVPDDATEDADKAKPYIEDSGATYSLVMQVTGRSQRVTTTTTPSVHSSMMWGAPRSFWGPTWNSSWAWGWGSQTQVRTDDVVGVQTLIYALDSGELVWAGQSETINPVEAEGFMSEMIAAIGGELQEAGLIPE